MKKLIATIIVLITLQAASQTLLDPFQLSFTADIDPVNAVFGSDVNGPALDVSFGAELSKGTYVMGITTETFPEIKYSSLSFYAGLDLYLHQNHPTSVHLLLYPEANLIFRPQATGAKTQSFSLGFNNELRIPLSSQVKIGLLFNIRQRPEWGDPTNVVLSGKLKLIISPKFLKSKV